MWMQNCFKSGYWNTFWSAKKKGVLDRDPCRKRDSRTCERKTLSECDSCVCILKMRAEAMHKRMGQSARVDCAVGAKYYLTVCRSWSWLGRRLQCMWTHVVQITIPKRLSERDSSPCEHSHNIAECGLSRSNGQVHNFENLNGRLGPCLGTSSRDRLLVESALFAFSKTAYGKELVESLKC